MDKRSEILKQMIDNNWKSRRAFAEHIGLPPSTLTSMLDRGIGKASVDNVIKVCNGLGITTGELLEMAESGVIKDPAQSPGFQTIAAHIDENASEEEIEAIKTYIEFLKSQRKK